MQKNQALEPLLSTRVELDSIPLISPLVVQDLGGCTHARTRSSPSVAGRTSTATQCFLPEGAGKLH